MRYLVQIFTQNDKGQNGHYNSYENGMVNVTRLLNVYKPKKGYEIVEIQITPTLEV